MSCESRENHSSPTLKKFVVQHEKAKLIQSLANQSDIDHDNARTVGGYGRKYETTRIVWIILELE